MTSSGGTAEELRRALQIRAHALAAQISALAGNLGGARLPLRHALDLFGFFPVALLSAVEAEWQRNTNPTSREQILRPLLRHTNQVASFVELWLSHGDRPHLSHALEMAIWRECQLLGLGHRDVVIANGPADNFLTIHHDLEERVFKPLGPVAPSIPAEIAGRQFALLQLPRLEGAEAMWRPIVSGHEVAHLAVEHYDAVTALDLPSKFDFARAANTPVPTGVVPALWLFEVAQKWSNELLCDAYAVHRFGPAGVAALAEFLTTIGADRQEGTTHPPGLLRIELLLAGLVAPLGARSQAVVAPWQELVQGGVSFPSPWVAFLADLFRSLAGELHAIVAAWPAPRYDSGSREPVVEELTRLLELGIPGDQAVQVAPPNWERVEDADLINACWASRVAGSTRPYERLTTKGLENNEFVRRWEEAGGSLPSRPETPAGPPTSEGAVLSEDELRARVHRPDAGRLVVTPLLPNFSKGAGLDVRLGSSFIVFVRSRTPSFDPLSKHNDPRSLQRLIELAWGETLVLHPGELVLAATLEYLALPEDLTAQVITRSSYGRLGLLSATAVQIHPHFHGCLTLELVNLGTIPVELTPGERVAQLVVSRVSAVPPPADDKYGWPTRPEFSKVRDDPEVDVLNEIRRRRVD